MRLFSWNVNGIRSCLKKGFLDFVASEAPDALCLQEVRATPDQIVLDLPGYEMVLNPAEKKGYSGTAIFTKVKPVATSIGLGIDAHDHEGRVVTVEYGKFFLVTVYTPNAQRLLTRLEYRANDWDPAFLAYVKKLEETKPVVFCGDLNVAHTPLDLANPRSNEGNAGYTPEERAGFDRILQAGFIDTFRVFTAEGGHYTWWSNFGRAREKNVGWRIDYFCISAALKNRLVDARILPSVRGSDHCPVMIELKD